MESDDVFSVRLMTNQPKDASDAASETHGVKDRSPKKKRGRKRSPRTGQVHAKVLPEVSKEIAAEARWRGVQQGVLIEEAWALYQAHKDAASRDT